MPPLTFEPADVPFISVEQKTGLVLHIGIDTARFCDIDPQATEKDEIRQWPVPRHSV